MPKKKVLLVFPEFFSKNPSSYRARRMIRSLSFFCEIILLCKAPRKQIRKMSWGFLVSVEKRIPQKGSLERKTFSLKSFTANKILSPDAGVRWNSKVLKSKEALGLFSECDFLISSSPPHSIHLLAKSLSKLYKMKWLMDLRDGWLDEPLKKTLFFLKGVEKKQEKSCLDSCSLVIVNNTHWKKSLLKRYPEFAPKTQVLMNAVEDPPKEFSPIFSDREKRYLLYSGSFRLSDSRRTAKRALDPLFRNLGRNFHLRILVIGRLHELDKKEISELNSSYESCGVESLEEVSRDRLRRYLKGASGLFLSSHSVCALPSKLFDYLSFDKPILGFCKKNSILDEFLQKLDGCWSTDPYGPDDSTILEFLKFSIENQAVRSLLPESFSESYFKEKLLSFL